ncbi:ANTAR domain-containing protein [Streptomyces sp. NPDC053560]|uniref:ANTAR domain-containing protein n=1 Tax=Streptomyces sp. NPDC053560 TaxID=3365711 RepID=UPI0037CFF64B
MQAPCSVGLTLAADAASASRISLCCDGPLAEAGETLEVNLGEGPCVQALQQRASIRAVDLTDPEITRPWPLYAIEAPTHGIRAVLALPTAPHPWSAARAGIVLALYRGRPGPLSPADRRTAGIHLDAAQLLLRTVGAEAPDNAPPLIRLPPDLAAIHQAIGIISHRHILSVDQALGLLRAHAHSRDIDLSALAHAVVHDGLPLPEEG